MANMSPITVARFWSKVEVQDNMAACWDWTRTRNANGYGRFTDGDRKVAAHRFAYEACHGGIPEGLYVRHMCHNRLCCNPSHLDVGTAQQNTQDSIDAGRFARGPLHGNAKLRDEDIIYIRQNPEKLTGRGLANRHDQQYPQRQNLATRVGSRLPSKGRKPMTIWRYRFIWWDTWAYEPWETVSGCVLSCIYDRAGRWGHLEIRRFIKRPAKEGIR